MELHILFKVVMSLGVLGFLGVFLRLSISEAVAKADTNRSPAFHDCEADVFPFLDSWRKQYGDVYMFALGNTQTLSVTDPDMGMYNLIQESTATLVNRWESIIENQGGIADIKVDQHLRSFAGDVISRACFGSNFSRNKEIFSRLRALQDLTSKAVLSANIPGMRLLPTKINRARRALEKELRTLILKVVKERNEVGGKNNLLQTLLHEWQDHLRAEAHQVCKGQIPNVDMVLKMKQLAMVIHETLRLYPSSVLTTREALEDKKFGGMIVPKGVNVWIGVTRLHTDPEIWGPDAYKFNPERFANGVTGACKQPHLYIPFGFGPRVCPGQNLALAELKVLIAVIVTKFSFSLSPKYLHKPSLNLNTEPGTGVDLLVKKL
ncbi:hypothetical protein RJ639_029890 [Escallonia herrerae]|uniref:Cytochrome P450 n=1 Tax=Escallonia herrerae TaxID=1293975 RepID=A0AA88WXQ2_9ASTE|nr:hypothetical protein RJ639_029890 [Escallonia herrerae]